MDLIQDLDDILSQMEDIKYKKTPPVPPPKPTSRPNANKSNGKINGHHHGKNDNCPHLNEYPILSRADTHPHVPQPHPINLDDHTTCNTLFPTPAPPTSKPQPMSPVAKKREVIKSPFDPETRSDELRKFGVNESNDDHKFNSYHLDYKYTPPPIKGPCIVCGEGIIGPLVTAMDHMWHPEHFCCANCHRELRPPYFLEHDGEPYCKACHQQLFLPPCAACGLHIPDKYINAMGKVWHPECFVCTKCGVMLPEKDFKEKSGKPYCEKDYHDLFSPKCSACHKPITDGKKTTALGRDWHPNCFKCAKCGCVLNPNKFYERDGIPYCEDDYNDLFLPKCAGCSMPIKQNITRVMGKTWHPQCFRCIECKKVLTPTTYFEKNGFPYCEDDFHKKFSPKCAGCKAPIKENPTNAMGKTWHPQCFKCAVCSKKLSPSNFFERDGIPYCEDDYHNKFSPKCAGCAAPIKENPLHAMNKTWHPNCFKCAVCGKKLSPSNYFEKDGIPYCEDDYHNKFSPRCFNCNGPIKQNPTRALGKLWHPHCFKCTECGKQLLPTNFREKHGNPYCEEDYHKLFSHKCHACKQPITDGNPVHAMGKTWHADHFSCSDCGKNLSPNNFYERDGRLYCEDDFHRRFSPKCASCHGPIKDNRAVVAMGKNWHPEHFRCTACNKQLAENAFYEHDGKPYCVDDFMNMFAPKCKGCKQPIKDAYCLYALGSDWHPNCFRCKDCSMLLEETNFFDFEGEPYCERHYHERMCPDCIKMRRALERYCGRTTVKQTSAVRTLNLPPRPNSRQSQTSVEQKVVIHDIQQTHSHVNVPAVVINDERPLSSQSHYSMESTYKEERNGGSHVSPYSGSEYSTAIRTPSPMTTMVPWNGANQNASLKEATNTTGTQSYWQIAGE
ncbi:unnamed protein product [Allacma fusca]|uniref:LIM zinc-binding domain-containing protein n=1 Tax=Allacma fusca TaxID=39272 RepID=A0A8J2KM29_9HEXA|nr:unnamed protein product [Allacma fusca]